jgi:3-oxoacyl-[acyl-carrier protein] reductase
VIEDFGGIDILSTTRASCATAWCFSMKEEDFDAVIATNLKGAFNMNRHVLPISRGNARGRIINVSSVSGMMGNPGQSNYSASKAGRSGLTKTVAKELAPAA